MMHGLYTSSMGMQTHTQGLGIIGNNLANTNTIGFKQQMMLFQNFKGHDLPAGNAYELETKQLGGGSHTGFTRTLFTPAASAATDRIEDLAINGRGFFQVSDGHETFYTRAGNFHFDAEGTMRTPGMQALSGIKIVDGVETGQLSEINLDLAADSETNTNPSKATSSLTSRMNINAKSDTFSDPANPFFSMIQSWDGTKSPPLSGGNSLSLHYYDNEGVSRDLEVYFDKVPSSNGEQVYEYAIAMDPELDARDGYANTKSAGLLAAGTMTFSPAGELKNMNSFSPTGGDLTKPNSWTLSGGPPSVNIKLPGQDTQNIQLNFGITGDANMVTNSGNPAAGMNAGSIGTNFSLLPGMTNPAISSNATAAVTGSSALKDLQQDGYPEGDLSNLHFDTEGILHASYTNGQSQELYRVPIFRFASEDGLRREGDNLFSHTDEAGKMEYGKAGTENYGKVHSKHLEQSNVDMSREMVNMIVVQRGFQSNSKSMQTIDTMIQKAIEMKR